MRITKRIGILLLSMTFIVGCESQSAEEVYETNDTEAEAFYNNSLKPVIDTQCISCHNYHLSGDSRYDTFEKTKNSISQILERIHATDTSIMPPESAEQTLTEAEIALFDEFATILTSDGEQPTKTTTLRWTAYKYPTSRAAVSGTFDDITVQLNNSATTSLDLLEGATVEIDTETVSLGPGEKNSNMRYFFSFFSDKINAKIVSYTANEAIVEFEINSEKETATFTIDLTDTELTLTGTIDDMTVFTDWTDALEKLDVVCGTYHQSKVWDDIALSFTINL